MYWFCSQTSILIKSDSNIPVLIVVFHLTRRRRSFPASAGSIRYTEAERDREWVPPPNSSPRSREWLSHELWWDFGQACHPGWSTPNVPVRCVWLSYITDSVEVARKPLGTIPEPVAWLGNTFREGISSALVRVSECACVCLACIPLEGYTFGTKVCRSESDED